MQRIVTATTGLYSFLHPAHGMIHLIDTPGFDDTTVSDTDVLKNIASFLSATYKKRAKLTGVIYMHRITDNRVAGSSLRNIKMFKELCGDDAYKHVVLSTSMWGKEHHATAVRRERELKEEAGFWGLMHSRGSAVMRWDNDEASALAMVEHLLERRSQYGPAILRIQRELVDEHRELDQTSAGQAVNRELAEAKKRWAAEIELLRTEHQEAMKERDRDLAERLLQQESELRERLKKADRAQTALRVNLEQLLSEKTKEWEIKQKALQEQLRKATELIAARERELKSILDARIKDAELYEEMQREIAQERRNLDERDVKGSKQLKELEASLKKQYEEEARESRQREKELKAKLKKSKDWKHYLLVCVPPLVGIGLVVAGLATGNVALLPPGIAMMVGASRGS